MDSRERTSSRLIYFGHLKYAYSSSRLQVKGGEWHRFLALGPLRGLQGKGQESPSTFTGPVLPPLGGEKTFTEPVLPRQGREKHSALPQLREVHCQEGTPGAVLSCCQGHLEQCSVVRDTWSSA